MKTKPKSKTAPDVTAALEADLLSGVYRPGEWLKQADIENTYQAHRFDVRMALLDLKTRHLIEHVRNRGYRVANPTEREREDLTQTRVILEKAAAGLVLQNITRNDIDDLKQIIAEFDQSMLDGDLNMLRAINGRFHDRFYEICRNGILTAQIKSLRQRGLPGARTWLNLNGIRRSHDDHKQMVKLLAKKDLEGLEELVGQHLSHWRTDE
ncbi:MAG TPA: GntR family transcriptional regulator [Rhodanobacter sp.]